jgi:predicted nucleotidyltransferase
MARARGDHRPDSDWDIALYVRGLVNPYVEYGPLADLAGRLLAEADIEINARLFPAEAFLGGGSALHAHIRREGLSL